MNLLISLFCICCALGIASVVSGCGRGGELSAHEVNASVSSKLVFDSERDSYQAWHMYSRDGHDAARVRYKVSRPNDPALVELTSITGTPMGVNMEFEGLRGIVSFEYKVFESNPNVRFGFFALPIKKIVGTNPPIEVGSDTPADPNNIDSTYRARFVVPANHNDGQWHQQTLSFDFTGLPDAASTIIAPRVNELSGASGSGRIQFRHIRVSVPQ